MICRFSCPTTPTPSNLPTVNIVWSKASTWPSGKVPDGTESSVVIESNWAITLDTTTAVLKQLIVDGSITFGTLSTTGRML